MLTDFWLLFWQFVESFSSWRSDIVEKSDENADSKKRKIGMENLPRKSINLGENENASSNSGNSISNSLTHMT